MNEPIETTSSSIDTTSATTAGPSSSRRLREVFSEKGFVYPVSVLTEEEAAQCCRQLEEYEAVVAVGVACQQTHNGSRLSGDARFKIHLLLPWAWELVHHSTIVQVVRECLGTDDIWCWSTDLNMKEPKSDSLFTWHQDSTYAGIVPPNAAVTVWLALTPSNVQSGCLQCIPGSHTMMQLEHAVGKGGEANVLALKQEISSWPTGMSPDHAENVVLRPGQASLHSFLCVHSSEPNNSDHRRIGLAIRYVSAHCQKQGSVKEMGTLVSGDGRGLFDPEPKPQTWMGTKEKQVHAAALELERRNYLPEGQCYS